LQSEGLSQSAPQGSAATAALPSPLAGEGARRADEGYGAAHPNRLLKSSELTKGRARALRRNSTGAEKRLWGLLRSRRFDGFKFRRQVPIGRYIAEFVCFERQLIVELDGSQHADSLHDARRDAWLRDDGYRVLRIWNNELSENLDGVGQGIWAALQEQEEAR
jgi:very-short-patch-repair endonuclease